MPTLAEADAPLLVTAHLDDDAFAILEDLRGRHFPPALNKVPAHISLFHDLPGGELTSILATMRELARDTAAIPLTPLAPRSLGRGVALAYESAALTTLHGALAARWHAWLTPQDRQPFRAHVTIQNKVAPAEARALLAGLAGQPGPACVVGGLDLWRYRGGPWETVARIGFGL